jgi:hypothetical protein
VNKTFIAGLAGALAVLVVVGAFLALDRTTLHWYAGDDASEPAVSASRLDASPRPTVAIRSSATRPLGTPSPRAVVQQSTQTRSEEPSAPQPTSPPEPASTLPANPQPTQAPRPAFQPGEATAIAVEWWQSDRNNTNHHGALTDCVATWRVTRWEVGCHCAATSCVSYEVLCVYETTRTVSRC